MTYPHHDLWALAEQTAWSLRDFVALHNKFVAPKIITPHWEYDDAKHIRLGKSTCHQKEEKKRRRFSNTTPPDDEMVTYQEKSYQEVLEKVGLSGHDRIIFTIEMQKLNASWNEFVSILQKTVPAFENPLFRLGMEHKTNGDTTTLYMSGLPLAVIHDKKTKTKYKTMFCNLISLLENAPKDKRFHATMRQSGYSAPETIVIPAQNLTHANDILDFLVWPQSSSFYKISPEKTKA